MLIRRMASALSKRDICCGSCLDRKHWSGFSLFYLSSLGPFRTFYGLKFDAVSFRQAPISDILNCRIMNKDVRAISLPDKTIPFELVEPFDFANHSVSFQKRHQHVFHTHSLRPGKYVRSAGEAAACAGNDRRTSSAQPTLKA